jgi:hypothetical protein
MLQRHDLESFPYLPDARGLPVALGGSPLEPAASINLSDRDARLRRLTFGAGLREISPLGQFLHSKNKEALHNFQAA